MHTTQRQHRQARIAAARAHVHHCHAQLIGWAQNTAPELISLRTFAIAHYAQHKQRALNHLQSLITQ